MNTTKYNLDNMEFVEYKSYKIYKTPTGCFVKRPLGGYYYSANILSSKRSIDVLTDPHQLVEYQPAEGRRQIAELGESPNWIRNQDNYILLAMVLGFSLLILWFVMKGY